MKKLMLVGILAMSTALFAHHQFLYTDKLDISGEKEINVKLLFGHPSEGKTKGAINVATVDGVAHNAAEAFVVHNGEKTDILSKVKASTLKTDVNDGRIFEFNYGMMDGLKGKGDFVFFVNPGRATDSGYGFNGNAKLIVAKDGSGSDWNKRIADGHPEIVPLVNPVNAWKENGFTAVVVDKDGNPVVGSRMDVAFFNAKLDSKTNMYKGGEEMEKTEINIYTDANGTFNFVPPRDGMWIMRANMPRKAGVKEVHDATLLVEFK